MFGFLITPATPWRGKGLVRALHNACPYDKVLMESYRECETLVLYGVGGPDRYPIAQRHKGRLITFDAGYWHRKLPETRRKYRVSIDDLHPNKLVMKGSAPEGNKWVKSGLSITTGYDPDGPIMLVGNAPKSVRFFAQGWSARRAHEIRRAFPGKKILYRPKPKRPKELGIDHDGLSTGKIDEDLVKCSLVVCRHSNVAVDACRLGVPVVCDDGAAAAIYPQRLEDYENQPSLSVRTEFLHRLAWWQWSIDEIRKGELWRWFGKVADEVL